LDETAVRLAVIAHARRAETRYDALMAQGWDRRAARAEVEERVQAVLAPWEAQEYRVAARRSSNHTHRP
jgi:hypothetical protein